MGKSSVPTMRFASEFWRNCDRTSVRRVKHLHVSNVVLHASLKQTNRRTLLSKITGRPFIADLSRCDELDAAAHKITSPFCQHRVFTANHGSISLFNTGNVIRAAKGHPAKAVAAMALFSRWLFAVTNMKSPPWFTAVSAPNAVATGEFDAPLSNSLKTSWRATKTSKFPGIAITLPNIKGVTPECFDKNNNDGKFIVPGFKTPRELALATGALSKMQASLC